MAGRLLRTLVIWSIPPRHAGPASATLLLAAAVIVLTGIHSFPGVLTAIAGAGAVIFGLRARRRGSRPV